MSRQPKCLVTLRLQDRSVRHLSFSSNGSWQVWYPLAEKA
ncbi:UNVERIFIED_ORG: hypothetical protein ABIB52_000685 [Arthrobacter sp. UYCu721]